MKTIGIDAIITIVVQLGFIWITFRCLQELHIERLFRQAPKTMPLLKVLLSIAIGYGCASFFMSFFGSLQNLGYLLK
ncbi:DUF1146 family protein [Paucilactobacillus suebicus]|uniref:Uncharacterized protein n=1 Tax=Paucilactobacillus suebicus DSM 5007 = KCTC 3549 TaxID=1423807 RepID=A0A0R1WD04_9LACO|nr:DUF1146 family protein [Paucilactobacillus suebicus]KRM13513.1 hypothetical protein FD16_GL000082 [Paucilactobacillus suebicus DSM 5007 = KCTC 3549]